MAPMMGTSSINHGVYNMQMSQLFQMMSVRLCSRFEVRDDRSGVEDVPLKNSTRHPDETCDPVYCDCKPGGSYFVTQNTFANFSRVMPQNVLDTQSSVSDVTFEAATELLSEVFIQIHYRY